MDLDKVLAAEPVLNQDLDEFHHPQQVVKPVNHDHGPRVSAVLVNGHIGTRPPEEARQYAPPDRIAILDNVDRRAGPNDDEPSQSKASPNDISAGLPECRFPSTSVFCRTHQVTRSVSVRVGSGGVGAVLDEQVDDFSSGLGSMFAPT